MQSKMLVKLPFFVSIVIGLLSGCGKLEERAPWPGHIRTVSGFSDAERAQITEAIDSLNKNSGKTLVSMNEANTNFSIEIYKVSASSWPQSRAGFATVKASDCKVEISDGLFTATKSDYLHPVVWHEIGHCAGLGHSKSEGEIMSPTTSVLSTYASTIIEKFIQSVQSSAGI